MVITVLDTEEIDQNSTGDVWMLQTVVKTKEEVESRAFAGIRG